MYLCCIICISILSLQFSSEWRWRIPNESIRTVDSDDWLIDWLIDWSRFRFYTVGCVWFEPDGPLEKPLETSSLIYSHFVTGSAAGRLHYEFLNWITIRYADWPGRYSLVCFCLIFFLVGLGWVGLVFVGLIFWFLVLGGIGALIDGLIDGFSMDWLFIAFDNK